MYPVTLPTFAQAYDAQFTSVYRTPHGALAARQLLGDLGDCQQSAHSGPM